MSRRGNMHFFQLLKRDRIKKKICRAREEARSDIFDYIDMFYNSQCRHGASDLMPARNMKITIINGSEVSGLSVAIHTMQMVAEIPGPWHRA